MPITLDDRRDFVDGMVPLYLHVAWRLLREDRPFADVFNIHTDIYRLTILFDGQTIPYHNKPGWRDAAWDSLLVELRRIHQQLADEPDSTAFERAGYALLLPVLEPAFPRAVAQWPMPADRPYGFFACNLAEMTEPEAQGIEIHLFNPFAPVSPFADPTARLRELRRLVDDMCAAHPEVTDIATGTWLNAFPPFLALFPPEWAASATEVRVAFPGAGLWGQFYDHRGRFHRGNAAHYRETGTFRYLPMHCRCRLDTLRAFLGTRLSPTEP